MVFVIDDGCCYIDIVVVVVGDVPVIVLLFPVVVRYLVDVVWVDIVVGMECCCYLLLLTLFIDVVVVVDVCYCYC